MRATQIKLHRDLPPTQLWTYGGSFPGPTIEARSGQGLTVEWVNELPVRHMFSVDHRLHGAEASRPEVRTVVHVHGAKAPSESDGYPEDWYEPGRSATYSYPNEQDAAQLWYHDHAMGITRLNIYAGLLGAYVVRDSVEDALGLPSGPYEIPLIVCDRFLRTNGQLDYPVSGDREAPWIPELAANVMLVNGKAFPYLDVEPRWYRFRILNASNSRFYRFSLNAASSSNAPKAKTFQQIGTDQGLLPSPVEVGFLTLAPGERADVLIDFAGHAGEQIVLADKTVEIMQFSVGRAAGTDRGRRPSTLRPIQKIPESSAVKTRILTLDEIKNGAGDSIQMLLNNTRWHMPVTENPKLDSTEIWTILNPTDDSHPIHLHMVRFQILDRRRYDPFIYATTGQLRFNGPVEPPEPNEDGWKDTVRAHANMVTRIIVRFSGFRGRFVWHCHVLEHEDNEMMRPYVVA